MTLTEKKLQREIEKLVYEDFMVFMLEKWKITSGEYKNEPYSLRERPYMLGIIEDDFPFVVVKKSAQCGISEVECARAVWRAVTKKGNVLYTFPAGEQMQQFVDSRIREAIINSEWLSQFVTGSLNLKKFSLAGNQIYFRGVQKRRQVISVDVSVLFADEVDEYEEGTLYTLDKRLGAAKDPIRHYFSTPTFHGTGISLYYYGSESQRERGSDQRIWTIKCDACGKWNEDLIWEENVVDTNEKDAKFTYYEPNTIVICRFCKKALNRLSSKAEWVVKFGKNSDYCHGYTISKLFSPVANLNQMMIDSRDPLKEQEFNNSDLGRPYEPKGARLTDEAINNARGTHQIIIRNKVKAFLGADIGNKIHVVSAIQDENKRVKLINASELDSWDDLPAYWKDMGIYTGVLDANPDKEEAISFQKEHEGAWLAYYSQHLENTVDRFKLDWDDSIVHIHRTLMMQIVSDFVYNKDLILPIDIGRIANFYEHLKSPIKAQKQDTKGNWVTFYPKTKIPDHYYHAILYLLSAVQLRPSPAKLRKVNILTRLYGDTI